MLELLSQWRTVGKQQPSSVWDQHLGGMESHDYEHYRNLTLMFFFEKLLEKGGENRMRIGWSCEEKCGDMFPKFHQEIIGILW